MTKKISISLFYISIHLLMLVGLILAENVRSSLFCPEGFGSGVDCYARSWVSYPNYLVAFFAGLTAVIGVVYVQCIILAKKQYARIKTAAIYFVPALLMLFPMSLMSDRFSAYLSYLIMGVIVFIVFEYKRKAKELE